MQTKQVHKKFIGTIHWITPPIHSALTNAETQTGEIPRAIMIRNNLNLEWSKNAEGGIKLQTKDNINYSGQFSYEEDNYTITGKVIARLYNNEKGCLLIGQWFEEGYEFTWVVELKKVNKFADEKNK